MPAADVRPRFTTFLDWPTLGCLLAILLSSIVFKVVFFPDPPYGPYTLIINPEIYNNVTHLLDSGHWTDTLLPHEYEKGRYYWSATAILLTYASQRYMGGFASYLFFYTVFATITFLLAKVVSRSLLLSATLVFMFAFGTQLDYLFTYGNLIALYLVLTYIAVNFAIAALIVDGRATGVGWSAAYTVTLIVTALSNEMWLNYATSMIAASGFGVVWARRHSHGPVAGRSLFIMVATMVVLAVYLSVRLRLASQYLAPAAEEELLVTHHHAALLIDDAVNNFFSYMYTTLSNYLPSFLSGSISLTYLGDKAILDGQNNYDPPLLPLVVMQHLFIWRFYAGVLVTLFLGTAGWALVKSWRVPSRTFAIALALALMVLAGFSTHLAIKMRAYNAVPSLPYKSIVSITAWTLLIAYLTTLAWERLRTAQSRYLLVGGVWACVLVAGLTRPHMQAELLNHVGLQGFGDPLGQLLRWLR